MEWGWRWESCPHRQHMQRRAACNAALHVAHKQVGCSAGSTTTHPPVRADGVRHDLVYVVDALVCRSDGTARARHARERDVVFAQAVG